MSESKEWNDRLINKRWSQDDRNLSWKFSKEIDNKIDAFLNNNKEKVFVVGEYDLSKEPWRLLAVADFRKYGLKLQQEQSTTDKKITKLSLSKVVLLKR